MDALGEENVTKASVPVATTIITATTITVVPIASLARLKPILWLVPQRLINSFVRTIPSRLLVAPDSFRTGRTDRQCERLADCPDRFSGFHRLVGDLNPADIVLVIEIHLGAVVNGALAPTDFYNYPLLSADHEVGQVRPRDGITSTLRATHGRKSVLRANDWGIGASRRRTPSRTSST